MLKNQSTSDFRLIRPRQQLQLILPLSLFVFFLSDFAESACRTGYYASGSFCKRCPNHCVRCTSSTRCSQCNTRYYGSYCQHHCPSHCTACTSSTTCQGCDTGYYGSHCHHSCPSGCLLKMCRKSDGYCTEGCKTGYYRSGGKCKSCPSHCSSCTSSIQCSACKSGYWGTYCQSSCAHCSGTCSKISGCVGACNSGYYKRSGECKKCPTNCNSCTSSINCTQCKTGFWGSSCQYSCSSCFGGCSKDSGCSSCQSGYYKYFDTTKGGNECRKCPDGCTSCTDSSSCSACGINRFGSYCQYSCQGCQSICDRTRGCTGQCAAGFYKDGITDIAKLIYICKECPSGCESCTSASGCINCKDGHWGSVCDSDCDRNCKFSVCDKETGECSEGCNAGYKQIENRCIFCPSVCADCEVSNVCSACKDRYYLAGSTCSQCQANCESCSDSSSCVECITGRYGLPFCSKECSMGCKDDVCDQDTGECASGCKNTYYGNNCQCTTSRCEVSDKNICTECSSQMWYPRDQGCCPCSEDCKDNICYNNATCIECVTRKFGDLCENACSSQCRNSECDRDGLCFSCIDGYYGDVCDTKCISVNPECVKCSIQDGNGFICAECIPGNYPAGKDCQACSQNCNQGPFPTCHPATGHCKYGCIDKWSGSTCNIPCFVPHCELCDKNDKDVCVLCLDGFYAENSRLCIECSKTCQTDTCDKRTGLCTEGCKAGWSGNRCDEKCRDSNCLQCEHDNSDSCISCVHGYYGEDCNQACSSNCKREENKQTCEKGNGRCTLGCMDGYWGNLCSKSCSDCGNFICSRQTGNCLSSCKVNYYGDSCEGKCSDHCNSNTLVIFDSTCDERGECYGGCDEGWWGKLCNNKCNEHCNRTKCDADDGRCIFGCSNGYTGYSCSVGPPLAATGDDKKANTGLVVGLVVGFLLLAVVIAVVVFILYKRRKNDGGVFSFSWKSHRKSSASSSSSSSNADDEYEGLSGNKDVDGEYEGLDPPANDPVVDDIQNQDSRAYNQYTTIDLTNDEMLNNQTDDHMDTQYDNMENSAENNESEHNSIHDYQILEKYEEKNKSDLENEYDNQNNQNSPDQADMTDDIEPQGDEPLDSEEFSNIGSNDEFV